MPDITEAIDYEHAIEIIPEEECLKGIYFLQRTLLDMFVSAEDFSLVPISRGGDDVGEALANAQEGNIYDVNPMGMSNYDKDGERLEKPRLKFLPDLEKIFKGDGLNTKDVVFAEAVVESQGTITGAMEEINTAIDEYNAIHNTHYHYPEYHTYTLVSKIEGETTIPNLVYAHHVDNRIWVYGWGCDSEDRGRESKRIMGYLSPFAKGLPQEPYFTPSLALLASLE